MTRHPCLEQIVSFDSACLKHVERKCSHVHAALMWSGLHQVLCNAQEMVLSMKIVTSIVEMGVNGNINKKRKFGKWSVQYIWDAVNSANERYENGNLTKLGWQKQLKRLIVCDLNLFLENRDEQSFQELYGNENMDIRRRFLERKKRERVFLAAARIQGLVRGFMTRRLPRWFRFNESAWYCIRGFRRINWDPIGEVSVRTFVRNETNPARHWNRMLRLFAAMVRGELVLFDIGDVQENEVTINTFDRAMTTFVRVYFEPDVSQERIEEQETGCILKNCVVDETGLNRWLTTSERERLNQEVKSSKAQTQIWLYPCSKQIRNVETFNRLITLLTQMNTEKDLRRHKRVMNLKNESKSQYIVEENKRLLLVEVMEVQAAMRSLHTENVRLQENIVKCERGEMDEHITDRVYAMVDRSMKRISPNTGLTCFRSFFARHYSFNKSVALTGQLKLNKRKYKTMDRQAWTLRTVACRRIITFYRSHLALKATNKAVKAEKARRRRFNKSFETMQRYLWDRARYREIMKRARNACCVLIIQGFLRRCLSREQNRKWAGNIISRFARCVLAKCAFRKMLAIKQENDRKLELAVHLFTTRKSRAVLRRWSEYVVGFKEWKVRYSRLHERMCSKVIQRNVRALLSYKASLKERVLSSLHPRLSMLLQEFLKTRDFDQLLFDLNEDYQRRNRLAISPTTMDMFDKDRTVFQMNKLFTTKVCRWYLFGDAQGVINQELAQTMYPFFIWPCLKIENDSQILTFQFWRVIDALNVEFWKFTKLKWDAELNEHCEREKALLSTLKRDLYLWKRKNPKSLLTPLNRASREAADVLDPKSRADICHNCMALFTKKTTVSCTRCGVPRVWLVGTRELDAMDMAFLHASFAAQIHESTDNMLSHFLQEDPESFFQLSSAYIRNKILDMEQEWWVASRVAKHWIERFKSAGYEKSFSETFQDESERSFLFRSFGVPQGRFSDLLLQMF